MKALLLTHAFSDSDKEETPPVFSDWRHLSCGTHVCATRKYSLLSWGEYSFFTNDAVYYHYKKKGIHEFLYYDYINSFDASTGMVDYGEDHQKRDISHWEMFEKKIIEQMSRIWEMCDETDTSALELCFNECHDFCMELSYFKSSHIKSVFRKQCKGHHRTLQKNFDHIKINSMVDGKITLQYWYYFPKVEKVTYSADDTEYEQKEKELEQDRREAEAQEHQEKIYRAHKQLLRLTDEIAEVFQQSLYILYGVLFEKENITFMEEPDYTFEGPSFIDRLENLENIAASAQAFIEDYADKHDLRK